MCTVTWWRADAETFGIFFNRDERRTRPASDPVRTMCADDGTAYLAPRDPPSAGTWLLVNQRGFAAGVLNHYAAAAASAPHRGARSRGELPLHFAACASVDEAAALVARVAWADFAPVILVAWDHARSASWTWDGAALHADEAPRPPITTSSHRTDEVCRWRCERFARIVSASPRAGELAAYHDDTAHADGAFNVRMRRPDARTESVCALTVTPREVRFLHRRESADVLAVLDQHVVSLPRR